MSKINAIRLINVNYNHDAIHVSDETLHLNGQSTLISLQNGGGKSVLVQLLTAPFVQKRYRNVKLSTDDKLAGTIGGDDVIDFDEDVNPDEEIVLEESVDEEVIEEPVTEEEETTEE